MIPYSQRELHRDSKLILLEPVKNQKTKVLVKCSCGNEYRIKPQALFRDNPVLKCKDCSSKDRIKGYDNIGGLRQHPAYPSLDNMKQRCYNKNDPKYKYYGAKGVSICDEWLNSYLSFCKWADNNGYKKGLTIDRINPKGNYEPNNCRWVTKTDQRENKRVQHNNTSGFAGVSWQKNINKWFAYYWHNKKRINCGYHNTPEEAYEARQAKLNEKNIKYKRTKDESMD